MSHYHKHFSKRKTPQSQSIPGTAQVKNDAGGFAWQLDKWQQLDRFLILGTLGGTYYVKEAPLTTANAQQIQNCINEDGLRVVDRVVEISVQGRAHKNDPALFVLAMCASADDAPTRKYALEKLSQVARIGTHLFTFLTYVQAFRGWGRGLRDAVSSWYLEKSPANAAYQVIKYRQRGGWTHRDVLRKAHPVPLDEDTDTLFKWIVSQGASDTPDIPLVQAFVRAQTSTDVVEVAQLIQDADLPREAIPTALLNDVRVWKALLEKMPMTALIRNLGKMGNVGLLVPGAWREIEHVCNLLTDGEALKHARIHPIQILAAIMTYQQGHGVRGNLTWEPLGQVIDALDTAYTLSFQNVEPTNKRHLVALDVSGSMGYGFVSGVPGLSPRVAAAAMAMVTARTEPKHVFTAFSHEMVPLHVSPQMNLTQVVHETSRLPFGGTDCALPMIYALENGLEIDVFVVYTDSETWYGSIHPVQALAKYRRMTGIPAKLVVVGMEASEFSIADPNDPGMLDVVGFDTATPKAIAEFVRM